MESVESLVDYLMAELDDKPLRKRLIEAVRCHDLDLLCDVEEAGERELFALTTPYSEEADKRIQRGDTEGHDAMRSKVKLIFEGGFAYHRAIRKMKKGRG